MPTDPLFLLDAGGSSEPDAFAHRHFTAESRAAVLRQLAEYLNREPVAGRVSSGARETPTHYVWRLLASQGGGLAVDLHEFRRFAPERQVYASSVHNHRYDFSSFILAGGYAEQRYECVAGATPRLLDAFERKAGDVVSMVHSEFHRLARVDEGTVTLVAKSAPVRDLSWSVDLTTGIRTDHVPVEGRLPLLKAKLTEPR